MDAESEEAKGVPAWVMTFADLMTLLMCFFVLLLSFSEMDVAKFKQLSGSMKEAFGVQTDIKVKNIPKGTSIIAKEFSPGKPQPTPLNQVRQFTINSNKNTLDVGDMDKVKRMKDRQREAEAAAQRLRDALLKEIKEGKVLIRTDGATVIIHILEKDSFPSGKAELEGPFAPVLGKIANVLGTTPGAITVSGHTDDIPIRNEQFRSNWDLSAARAASVAHALLKSGGIEDSRIMVSGHADTQPRVPNDSPENRAKNRRIDITVISGQIRHRTWRDDEPAELLDATTGQPLTSNETATQ